MSSRIAATLTLVLALLAAPAMAQKVTFKTVPSGAKIYVESSTGSRKLLGTGTATYRLQKKQPNRIVVVKAGYESLVRDFPVIKGSRRSKAPITLALVNRVVQVSTRPAGGELFMNGGSLGTAPVNVVVPIDTVVTVDAKLPGYRAVSRRYGHRGPSTAQWPLTDEIVFQTRVVQVRSDPIHATLVVDGQPLRKNPAEIVIPDNQCVRVEATRAGYRGDERLYCNQPSSDPPPPDDVLELQRVLMLRVKPGDAVIKVDGELMGQGSLSLVLPEEGCRTVEVEKEGYVPFTESYCNQLHVQAPPTSMNIELRDRIVDITTEPSLAEIRVDGQLMREGKYRMRVKRGVCRNIYISMAEFTSLRRQVCNHPDEIDFEHNLHFTLSRDEAYDYARPAEDLANRNITVQVQDPDVTYDQAWKVLSRSILDGFDVLEVTDKETGYLRTAWEVTYFAGSTVRTRVVAKLGAEDPITFVVKILSEYADGKNVSASDDQAYRPWDQLLRKYDPLMETVQNRVRGMTLMTMEE